LYGFGLTAASSGLPLPEQTWNAAFGALYLTNINWDFFAFGQAKQRVKVAETIARRDKNDLQQEVFQQQVRGYCCLSQSPCSPSDYIFLSQKC
jgi:hypothetical protein